MAIEMTPNGTYGTKLPGGFVKALYDAFVRRSIKAYRRTGGTNRTARMMGFPVAVLTTRGAKSGEQRSCMVGAFPDGHDAWLIVASKSGAQTHPAWFHNMVQNQNDIWLEVGPRKLKVQGESLTGQVRTDALSRIAAVAPRYGKYQQQTDREIPIVRLTPSS